MPSGTARRRSGLTMVELAVASGMLGAVVLAALSIIAAAVSSRNVSTWVDAASVVAERETNRVSTAPFTEVSDAAENAPTAVEVRGAPAVLDWSVSRSFAEVKGLPGVPAWKDITVTVQPSNTASDLPPVSVTRRATAGDLIAGSSTAAVTFVAAGPGQTAVGDLRDLPAVTIVNNDGSPLDPPAGVADFDIDGTATVVVDLDVQACDRESPCRVAFATPDAGQPFRSGSWAFTGGTALGSAGEVQVQAGQQIQQTIAFGRAATFEIRPFAEIPGTAGSVLPAEVDGDGSTVCVDVGIPTGLDSDTTETACADDQVITVDSYLPAVGPAGQELPLLGGMDLELSLTDDTLRQWGVPATFGPAGGDNASVRRVSAQVPDLGAVPVAVAGGTTTWDLVWSWPNGGPATGQPGVADTPFETPQLGSEDAFVFVPFSEEPEFSNGFLDGTLRDVAANDDVAFVAAPIEQGAGDPAAELGAPGWSAAGHTALRVNEPLAPAAVVDMSEPTRTAGQRNAARLDGGDGLTVGVAAALSSNVPAAATTVVSHIAGSEGWELLVEHDSGRAGFATIDNGDTTVVWSRPNVVGELVWHHFAVSVGSDRRATVFVDGVDVTDPAFSDVALSAVPAAQQLQVGTNLVGAVAFLTLHAGSTTDAADIGALQATNQTTPQGGGPQWALPRTITAAAFEDAGPEPFVCAAENTPLCHSGDDGTVPYPAGRFFSGYYEPGSLTLPRWAADNSSITVDGATAGTDGELTGVSGGTITITNTSSGASETWDDLTTTLPAPFARVNQTEVTVRQDADSTGVRAVAVDAQGNAADDTTDTNVAWLDVSGGELQVSSTPLPPAGSQQVEVTAGGEATPVTVNVVPIAGQVQVTGNPTVVQNTIDPAALPELAVTVTDLAGNPMEDARVRGVVLRAPERTAANCTTAGNGQCDLVFSLPANIPAGPYTVAVQAGAAPTQTASIAVEQAAARLAGPPQQLVAGGDPVVQQLLVTDHAGRPFIDDAANVAVSSSEPGVTVTNVEFQQAGAWTAEVVAASDVTAVSVALTATIDGEPLSGSVTMPTQPSAQTASFTDAQIDVFSGFGTIVTGTATPQSTVLIEAATNPLDALTFERSVTVDENGTFAFPIRAAGGTAAHTVELSLSDTNGVERDTVTINVASSVATATVVDVDLAQNTSGSITIHVTAPDGSPAPSDNVAVTLRRPDGTPETSVSAGTTTDTEGNQAAELAVTLGPVPAGIWTANIEVSAAGQTQSGTVPVQVAPTIDSVEASPVTVGQGQTIATAVLAVDVTGEPMPAAWLDATTTDSSNVLLGAGAGNVGRDEVQIRTGRDGRAILPVQAPRASDPGTYTVTFSGGAGTTDIGVNVVPTLGRLSVSSAQGNAGDDITATVCALDINSQRVGGVTVTVPAVTSSDGVVATPAPRTFTTDSSGCGTTTLRIADTAVANIDPETGDPLPWPIRADAGPVRGRGNLIVN